MSNFEVMKNDDSAVHVKSWTKGVPFEDEAKAQLLRLSKMPFLFKHLAVMPDVHAGKGSTVGTVIATKNVIIPATVGVDLGCVDADTEFLTPHGWEKISDYKPGTAILETTPDGQTSWVVPHFVKKPNSDGFLHFKTKYGIDQMLSSDHRVLCWRIVGRKRERVQEVVSAEHLAKEHTKLALGAPVEFESSFKHHLELGANESILGLSGDHLRLQVAFMADGHLVPLANGNYSGVVKLKKTRKISRLRELLIRVGDTFTSGVDSTGATWFRFRPPLPVKSFGEFSFRNISVRELSIIADECLKWDGNEKDQVYFSRDKASADFIQYAFTVLGFRASIQVDTRQSGIDYRVFKIARTKVGLKAAPKSEVVKVPSSDGFQYCFTTSTGFWVMRRNGNIALTGNCGMIAVKTDLKASDLPENLSAMRSEIEAAVPHGGPGAVGAWEAEPLLNGMAFNPWDTDWNFAHDYKWMTDKYPEITSPFTERHFGTLGTGNHFVEVCLDETQNVWVMLHSGSRGIGNRIGTFFIEKAKEEMRRWFINLPDQDLAYLPAGSTFYGDYVTCVRWAQDFARRSREFMLKNTIFAMAKVLGRTVTTFGDTAVNCHHNYIELENHFGENVWVTRKGAVRARTGDLGIIPGSMNTGSFIVRGKGNKDSFTSCSHGAGRSMSRAEARRRFTLQDVIEQTSGNECRKDEGIIDELPLAYKDLGAVMNAQSDLVEVVTRLKAVICVKG